MESTAYMYPNGIMALFPPDITKRWMAQGRMFVFRKGNDIIMPLEMGGDVFLIRKGQAQIFHIHGDGKDCVVGVLSDGDFIHLLEIFTDRESEVFAKALTDLEVVAVNKEEIRDTVMNSPELALALLGDFSGRLMEMIEILSQVAYGKVEERLLFLLRKLTDASKEEDGWVPLSVTVTHQELAGMVASTRETVTVLINKLAQRGWLRQKEGRIWIRKEVWL